MFIMSRFEALRVQSRSEKYSSPEYQTVEALKVTNKLVLDFDLRKASTGFLTHPSLPMILQMYAIDITSAGDAAEG